MASISALAAAIRDRLLAEEPAPMPGFGVLRRVHVPARVETRPDGSRTLQPPRESLRLVLGQEHDPGPLALALARQLGLPVSQGREALARHVDQLEALVAAKGEVELDGVGIVRRTDRGLLFGADPALLATINASFHGLTSVGTAPEDSSTPEAAPAPPVTSEPIDTLDTEAEPAGTPTDIETANEPAPYLHGDGASAGGDGASVAAAAEGTFISVPSDGPPSEPPFSDTEVPSTAEEPHDAARLSPETESPTTDEQETDANVSEEDNGSVLTSPSPQEGTETIAEPGASSVDDPTVTVGDASPLETFFDGDPDPATDAAPDPFADPEDSTLADAAVDDLLAGIWTAGTPQPNVLGVDPQAIEDAEYDVIEPDVAPAEDQTSLASTSEPVWEPTAQPESPDAVDAPPEMPTSGIGRPFEPIHVPAGLPAMPVGWNPTVSTPDEEYEADPYDNRDRAIPWIPIGIGVAVIAIALMAVLMWPQIEQRLASDDVAPVADEAIVQTTSPAPEASGVTDDDPLAQDSALAEIDPEALAAAEEQFLVGPSDEAGESQTAGGGIDARVQRRERGELTRPSPEALAAAAAELAPEESRQTEAAAPPPTSSGSVPAPNVSGLPGALAASLSGSAPIRLDASGFTWVVSSTSTRADAEQAARRYRAAGFRSRVIEGVVNGQPMYRIAIGQFDTREAAYRVRDLLPADIRGRNDIWTLNLADV